MNSRYYKLLGLPEGASEDQIRKRYRKLVMQYHPDKNQAPGAEAKFIAIKEAYEVLSGKRPAPITTRTRSSSHSRSAQQTTVNKEAEQRKRAKEAKERLDNQKMREYIENERYFRKLTTGVRWKIMKTSALVGLLLALCMVADLALPHHYVKDEIISYNLNPAKGIGGSNVSLVGTKERGLFWVERMNYSLYSGDHKVWIESSWILHNPVRILAQDKVRMFGFHINFNFFRLTFLIVPLFLLPLFTVWYKRRKIAFTVLYQFSFYGVNGLMLIFLLSEYRWAHILSLGFL